jgi:hypothetical protein
MFNSLRDLSPVFSETRPECVPGAALAILVCSSPQTPRWTQRGQSEYHS